MGFAACDGYAPGCTNAQNIIATGMSSFQDLVGVTYCKDNPNLTPNTGYCDATFGVGNWSGWSTGWPTLNVSPPALGATAVVEMKNDDVSPYAAGYGSYQAWIIYSGVADTPSATPSLTLTPSVTPSRTPYSTCWPTYPAAAMVSPGTVMPVFNAQPTQFEMIGGTPGCGATWYGNGTPIGGCSFDLT